MVKYTKHKSCHLPHFQGRGLAALGVLTVPCGRHHHRLRGFFVTLSKLKLSPLNPRPHPPNPPQPRAPTILPSGPLTLTPLRASWKWDHTVSVLGRQLPSLGTLSSGLIHGVARVGICLPLQAGSIWSCGWTTACASTVRLSWVTLLRTRPCLHFFPVTRGTRLAPGVTALTGGARS